MVGIEITNRISGALKELYDCQGFKIEYAEAWTSERGYRVGKDTISRALNGRLKRTHKRIAKGLAEFIEFETGGSVSVSNLLSEPSSLREKDISGSDYSGRDVSNFDFSGANLEDANFDNADISHSKFCGANLRGANLTRSSGYGTDFTGQTFLER